MKAQLTANQKIFISEYLKDRNATRAYKVAYPRTKKESTASVCAAKLLRNAKVKAKIDEEIEAIKNRNLITTDRVINELALIAFQNTSDFMEIDKKEFVDKVGNTIEADFINYDKMKNLKKEHKSIISSINQTASGVSISFYDKLKALELLGKYLGIFTEKVELETEEPVIINVNVVDDEED